MLGAGAIVALLAGCSSAAPTTPAAVSAQSTLKTQNAGTVSAAFASDAARSFAASRPLPATLRGEFERAGRQAISHGDTLLFINANMTGNVYGYDLNQQSEVWSCTRCGGWGLATDPTSGDIAVGAYDDYSYPIVNVYHVAGTGLSQYAKLTINTGGTTEPFGLAYDARGNLFASETPSNSVAEFDRATIRSGSGLPNHIYMAPDFQSVEYIAVDGKTVVVDGVTAAGEFVAARLETSGHGGDTILNEYGSLQQKTGFPGGLAFDKHHNLIVDNQYGTVKTYAPPWTGQATSTLNWNYPANDYTAIALDRRQNELYAADFSSEYDGIGISNPYPLNGVGSLVTYPMAEIFVGITLTTSN